MIVLVAFAVGAIGGSVAAHVVLGWRYRKVKPFPYRTVAEQMREPYRW